MLQKKVNQIFIICVVAQVFFSALLFISSIVSHSQVYKSEWEEDSN